MEILTVFRAPDVTPRKLVDCLVQLGEIARVLNGHVPSLKAWYLTGNTLDEARQHKVFDIDWTPTDDALSILQAEFAGSWDRAHYVSIWDGNDDDEASVSMEYLISTADSPKEIKIDFNDESTLAKAGMVDVVAELASSTSASYVTVAPYGYFDRQAFPDKPGAGWMLYLARALKTKDVPEAGELVAVHGADGKQLGTIIISVADDVFSIDNPAHLEIAHNIEARLISNGWLPRFVDV
ncbi:Imm52 family immunity protein [Paraburkholderia sp.]|uniref:Imm52 family immunity protein n=1 Tax=Paraburkholderia sp. TaxID=1926495 RepID=UPI003D6F13EF